MKTIDDYRREIQILKKGNRVLRKERDILFTAMHSAITKVDKLYQKERVIR